MRQNAPLRVTTVYGLPEAGCDRTAETHPRGERPIFARQSFLDEQRLRQRRGVEERAAVETIAGPEPITKREQPQRMPRWQRGPCDGEVTLGGIFRTQTD